MSGKTKIYKLPERKSNIDLFRENWKHEVSIRGVKLIDIALIMASSSILGFLSGRILENHFKFVETNYPDTAYGIFILGIEIAAELGLIGCIVYICRNIMELVPSPFQGYKGWNPPKTFAGYDHFKVKELNSYLPYTIFLISTHTSLQNKIDRFIRIVKL